MVESSRSLPVRLVMVVVGAAVVADKEVVVDLTLWFANWNFLGFLFVHLIVDFTPVNLD